MTAATNPTDAVTATAAPAKPARRGDLDALRGFAMVLGIALHASLAYFPFPWPVQDAFQTRWLGLLYALIHGFRMPLFFLLSGFFTMLVLRRRGLRRLLEQRVLRILLPLVIATATFVPLDHAVFSWALGGDKAAIDIAGVRGRVLAETEAKGPTPLDTLAIRYQTALGSPRFTIELAGRSWRLFESNVFDHLWFLWYLCWLVAGFAAAETLGLGPTGRHRWWLVPASCLPFALMWSPFGPDTALGLLPAPHLFLFYGCFYWFGAATYAAEGGDTPLGRRWPLVLPLSLAVLFPAGLATIGDRGAAAVLQPLYAWGMSLGLIGLFRRCFARPSERVRWLSDASYWMYLVHLPLVVVCQVLLADASWPAVVKCLVVLVAVVALSLVSYRLFVRFTPIGWLLNGPRERRRPAG
jgi:peptidoglycan/LPS O-acetylase OafA/YrhL